MAASTRVRRWRRWRSSTWARYDGRSLISKGSRACSRRWRLSAAGAKCPNARSSTHYSTCGRGCGVSRLVRPRHRAVDEERLTYLKPFVRCYSLVDNLGYISLLLVVDLSML